MAYIRKRSGKYSVEIRKLGTQNIFQTFNKKSDAIKFANQREVEIQQRTFKDTTTASKTLLKDLLLEEKAIRKVKGKDEKKRDIYKINKILRYDIVNKSLIDLDNSDFAKYRDIRFSEGRSGSTINREFSIMSVLIQRAIDEKNCWLPTFPLNKKTRPKENPPKERRLEEGELEKIFNYCNNGSKFKKASPFWKPSIIFAIETCMRQGEQFKLNWKDINFDKRTAFLSSEITKSSQSRTIPLSTKAIEVLNSLPRNINGKVFPMSGDYISKGFSLMAKKLNLLGLTWHCLRREGISRLLENGFGVSECMRISGHSTLKAFEIYIKHNVENLTQKLAINDSKKPF